MSKEKYNIKNKVREIAPLSVGKGEPTRVVTNIGLVPDVTNINVEFKKAVSAIEAGTDIISDVSIDKNYRILLEKLIKETEVPIATVPLYGTCINALKEKGAFVNFEVKDILKEVKYQAQLGVDIMTFHAALTLDVLKEVKKSNRLIKIPSRGGAFVAAYMIKHNQENPLYENFDEILNIAKEFGVTVSIGASVRPGSVYDGLDKVYIKEIEYQAELVERAIKRGVNVMVEGVGHMPADLIPTTIRIIKELCKGVPIRPLPIATDIAAGHDHIASSIAATLSALSGADILSVITRGEHVGLPRVEDIVEGVKAFKIAAYIADIVKLKNKERDKKVSTARNKRLWKEIFENCLYPEDAINLHKILSQTTLSEDKCTMCGPLCALKIVNTYLKKEVR